MQLIEAMHLRKEFGTLVAVNDISLSVDRGQVVGLVGPNGAGKTTLCGFNLHKEYLKIRRHIGFLPDFFNLYNDLTLCECLHFLPTPTASPPTNGTPGWTGPWTWWNWPPNVTT